MMDEKDMIQNDEQPFQESVSENEGQGVESQKNTFFSKKFLIIASITLVVVLLIAVIPSFLLESIPVKNLSRQEVFKKLTNNSWCTESSGYPGWTTYTQYTFSSDGTSEEYYASDASMSQGGRKWNFEQDDATGEWFLLYDDGVRLRFALNNNGTLTFENAGKLKSCTYRSTFIKTDRDCEDEKSILKSCISKAGKQYNGSTLPPIELSPSIKKMEDKITANRWKKANDLEIDTVPTLLEIKDDYSYTATYRYAH